MGWGFPCDARRGEGRVPFFRLYVPYLYLYVPLYGGSFGASWSGLVWDMDLTVLRGLGLGWGLGLGLGLRI